MYRDERESFLVEVVTSKSSLSRNLRKRPRVVSRQVHWSHCVVTSSVDVDAVYAGSSPDVVPANLAQQHYSPRTDSESRSVLQPQLRTAADSSSKAAPHDSPTTDSNNNNNTGALFSLAYKYKLSAGEPHYLRLSLARCKVTGYVLLSVYKMETLLVLYQTVVSL